MWGPTDASNISKMVSQIEFERVARKALLKSADASISTLVEHYSKEAMSELLAQVLRDAGAKAVGAAVASILRRQVR